MSQETCWTLIDSARTGAELAREEFARRYLPVVRAYLVERWRGGPFAGEVDDAVQEVFVECFRDEGALERADSTRGFRPFLFGTVRNVARRIEERNARRAIHKDPGSFHPELMENDEEHLSGVFDRSWAREIMRQAAEHMRTRAAALGESGDTSARRRVELLDLRFQEGLPIRDIARRWNEDAGRLHHEYARARSEFKECLLEVVSFHHPESRANAERECDQLLQVLA